MREQRRCEATGRGTHAEASEEEALQVGVLVVRDLEHARGVIEDRAGCCLVRLERVGGEHDECGADVDDPRGRFEDRGVRAVHNRHVESEVFRRRGRRRDRPVLALLR